MRRLALPVALAIVFPALIAAQDQQQELDASPTMFAVLAAINAAGYTADINSPNSHPLRQQVRDEILRKNPPSLALIKDFFEQHRKPTSTEELGQYVSFALSVNGPPSFAWSSREVDVPPDAIALREFVPLLAKFYKEADIASMWKRSQPAVDDYLARYHDPVQRSLELVNAYLRQTPSGLHGRSFQIYVELLAAPGQVQTRSYGYNYTIVVAPSTEPRTFDIRHAYLHYLLDPLTTESKAILEQKKVIGDHAQRAMTLDKSFKNDFLLLTTESLIKALEARLDKKLNGAAQALKQGYILTPFFSEQLPKYEKQEASMAIYFPDMLEAIDIRKEEARLIKVEFESAPSEPARAESRPTPPPPPPLTGLAATLAEADRLYSARSADPANLEKAKKAYLEVSQKGAEPAAQAAADYGLARIAVLENDPETAEGLFKKTLELEPAPQVKAWALVYLGRLSLAADDPAEAAQYFAEALKVNGASDAARQAAAEGLQKNPKQ